MSPRQYSINLLKALPPRGCNGFSPAIKFISENLTRGCEWHIREIMGELYMRKVCQLTGVPLEGGKCLPCLAHNIFLPVLNGVEAVSRCI